MKNETRSAVMSTMTPVLEAAFPNAEYVRVAKKNMLCVPTGQVDEDGNAVYATVEVTVKDPKGNKAVPGFDFEEAKKEYAKYVAETAEKSSKKSPAPKNTEASEKRAKRMKELRSWWLDNAVEGQGYTSTMVKGMLSDLYANDLIMTVGTDLKQLASEGFAEMQMVDGKKHYFKK